MQRKNLLNMIAVAAALAVVACGEPGDGLRDSQSALENESTKGTPGDADDADTDSDDADTDSDSDSDCDGDTDSDSDSDETPDSDDGDDEDDDADTDSDSDSDESCPGVEVPPSEVPAPEPVTVN